MQRVRTTYDCAIVGGGPAGLSAALVLGRARRRVLVLDAGAQSNLPAHGIGGLLGHDGLAPTELYRRGRAELAAYPTVEVRDARVVDAETTEDGFSLTIEDGTTIRASRMVLATGMAYDLPDLPGVRELWGGTVFHCPYCHGWEARDGALAVHGSVSPVHRVLLLRGWSEDVVLLTDGPAALDDGERAALERAGVPIDERLVVGVRGAAGALEAVVFADGEELRRDGLMVVPTLRERSGLAAGLGLAMTERGTVEADAFGRTSVPGLHVAGDVATMLPQVATAIAEGSRAAAMLNAELMAVEYGVEPVVPRPAVVPAG